MGIISWLVAIGGICIGSAVGVWGFTEINRTIVIWLIGVPGAICLVIAVGLELQRFASSEKPSPTEAEIRALRAYILVDASEIRNFNTDSAPEGWISLKNTGVTPALELERRGQIMLTPFPAKEFPVLEWGGAKGHLSPKGEVYFGPIPLPRALTENEKQAVISGASAIYVFGEIRYADTFNNIHTTKFRVFYRGNGTKIAPGAILATQQTNDNNEAD